MTQPRALDELDRFRGAFFDEVAPAACDDLHLDVGSAVVDVQVLA
jgi:hypothetical protein